MLDDLTGRQRLFTYKVMFDAGTAPNPFGEVCTLAICKPAIRRVAEPGDLVVGFAPGNEGRIVYCMQVTDKRTWKSYIDLCTGDLDQDAQPEYARLSHKVPHSELDQGDCIWRSADAYEKVRPSYSGHADQDYFQLDVENGKNVLLSTKFWYFGSGERASIRLPDDLRRLVPGRGHRSNGNHDLRDHFVRFFNAALREHSISRYGVHGVPKDGPEIADKSECSRCRAMQRADDLEDEEM